jgi:hypothetical protein
VNTALEAAKARLQLQGPGFRDPATAPRPMRSGDLSIPSLTSSDSEGCIRQ